MDETKGLEPAREAVEKVAGRRALDVVPTAAVWRFPHPDGRTTEAPVWLVRTPGQLWLAAVDGADAHLVATGDPEGAQVSRRWARDQIRVAGYLVNVLRRHVARAEQAVAAFKDDAGGPAYPPPASPVTTGSVAEGASGLPAWWGREVAGDPDDPWLFGCALATEWTFNLGEGPRVAPLVVGVRGRGLMIAAHAEGRTHQERIDGPIVAKSRLGRTKLEAGPYRLEANRLDGKRTALLIRLAHASEPERWALVATAALEDGRPKDAAALWAETLARGHRRAAAADLAVLALAVERPEQAVTLVREAGAGVESNWSARLSAWRRHAAKGVEALRATLDAAVAPAPRPGPGWPWPPASASEVWAAAGGVGPTETAASDPRRLQVEAASAEGRESPDVAAAAYRVAARAWAAAGDLEAADGALQSALRLAPDSPDHFQAAIWAHDRDRSREAAEHARAGLEMDPSAEALLALEPSTDVLEAVARVAEDAGHPATAARLLIRAGGALDRPGRLALARRIASELSVPAEAAAVIEAVAEADEVSSEDGVDALWLEAAELRHRAGERAAAAANLHRAVQAGFLRADVYRRAAAYEDAVGPSTAGWWHHLANLLSAQPPEGRPRAPVAALSRAQLDALHPGGAGWLADVSRWLNAPPPPARDHLIRGLERLESHTFADVFRAIADVCGRLELVPPATYVYRGDAAFGLSAWPVDPPVLLIGHQHLHEGPRHLEGAALRFALAVALVHLACGHPVLGFESSMVGTSTSAYQSLGRFAGKAETVVDLVTLVPGIDQLAKLERLIRLSRRLLTGIKTVNKASSLASPLLKWFAVDEGDAGGVGRERLEGAALQFRIQADRAALLIGGDAHAAVQAVLKTSSKSVAKLEAAKREGLAALLQSESLGSGQVVRLSALLGWSASLKGVNGVDADGLGV